jgi:hypothetical protein
MSNPLILLPFLEELGEQDGIGYRMANTNGMAQSITLADLVNVTGKGALLSAAIINGNIYSTPLNAEIKITIDGTVVLWLAETNLRSNDGAAYKDGLGFLTSPMVTSSGVYYPPTGYTLPTWSVGTTPTAGIFPSTTKVEQGSQGAAGRVIWSPNPIRFNSSLRIQISRPSSYVQAGAEYILE